MFIITACDLHRHLAEYKNNLALHPCKSSVLKCLWNFSKDIFIYNLYEPGSMLDLHEFHSY